MLKGIACLLRKLAENQKFELFYMQKILLNSGIVQEVLAYLTKDNDLSIINNSLIFLVECLNQGNLQVIFHIYEYFDVFIKIQNGFLKILENDSEKSFSFFGFLKYFLTKKLNIQKNTKNENNLDFLKTHPEDVIINILKLCYALCQNFNHDFKVNFKN